MLRFLIVLFVFSGTLHASEPSFTLDCAWDRSISKPPVGGPRYQIVKIAKKEKGKWANSYKLKAIPLNPTAKPIEFKLESAGSGDEDYNEFYVVDPRNRTWIESVNIHNGFEWATLVTEDGYGSYLCGKAETEQ